MAVVWANSLQRQHRSAPRPPEEVASVKKMLLVSTPGYPTLWGAGARMINEASFTKPSRCVAAHLIAPALRRRYVAVAGIVPPVQMQTIDPTSVPSALSCERRT
jgi:hypothetical protein